ncbi:hypothetical protein TRFO_06938 [Tritrichomonas foetus]|uniref:ATPase domain-containing protein n=1 Tax=Tritrichomonas foetus TaxID=1144522 RepID=A0A1J4K049_9EUKA|nr:hypothetical protein TRFO_06938 [Tritrichomonas foetus]|eukprot:OHT02885.1 hypothetical protein TRFO_06938 [Tritrichomonas foetus]
MNFSNPKRRNAVLGVGVFLLAAFIYYIITMRRTFERHSGRIPYVWNHDFNRTLRQYINTLPSRNVLVLTGPYQSGKSRALDVMANDLSTNHLVLNVDLSTAHSPEDVISLFRIAVINGLAAIYPHISSSKISKSSEEFKSDFETDKNIDPFFGRVYNAFCRVLDRSLMYSYSFTKFFDYLESLKTTLRPIVFIHNFDNFQVASPELYESAMARLSRRPLYLDFVPVVCEIRNSSFRISNQITPESLRFLEVKELKDPTRDLVVLTRALSDLELRKIMAAFGGHGGTIDRVFEDLKQGMSIEKSIEKQQKAVETYLRNLLNGTFPQPLYEVCRMNGAAKITNTDDLNALVPLLESGHLYLSPGFVVKTAHNGVKKALCGGYI